ncbi:MAG: DUF2007 domain-containing protein [Verrucomicrobiota bacterium]|nr:DUF2007 domain-containing protein [Limisphaera sp.]MDW8382430.1 DUF2007 domain-containing protein [Verrucomicrobiota bacterium]
MKLVALLRCLQPAEAHLARARLEAAGFHPRIAHEDAALSVAGYALAAGGILVQVPESEFDEAQAFLHDRGPIPGENDHA